MHICVNARLIFKKCNCEIIVSDSFFSEFNINQLNFVKILNYNFEGSDFWLMDGEIIKKHGNFFIYPGTTFVKCVKKRIIFIRTFCSHLVSLTYHKLQTRFLEKRVFRKKI